MRSPSHRYCERYTSPLRASRMGHTGASAKGSHGETLHGGEADAESRELARSHRDGESVEVGGDQPAVRHQTVHRSEQTLRVRDGDVERDLAQEAIIVQERGPARQRG